jgi:hypothetical protein
MEAPYAYFPRKASLVAGYALEKSVPDLCPKRAEVLFFRKEPTHD